MNWQEFDRSYVNYQSHVYPEKTYDFFFFG